MSARRRVNVGDRERLVSAAAGAFIAAWGIRGLTRMKFWGVPLTMIGAGLVVRGVTGHDVVYSALGIQRALRQPPASAEAEELSAVGGQPSGTP